MEKNKSDSFVNSEIQSEAQAKRAQDLERRIRVYEEMEDSNQWPGTLRATDYTAITLITLGLVITFTLWGY